MLAVFVTIMLFINETSEQYGGEPTYEIGLIEG